jgi:hypothetical protein
MDLINYFLFIAFVTFYIVYFVFRRKIKINSLVFKYSVKIHYLTIIILISIIVLSLFNLYLRGTWTNEIVMWVFLITNFIIQLKAENLRTEHEKKYFTFIFISPIFLILPWIIPMLGLAICVYFTYLFNEYEEKIYVNREVKLCYEEKFFNYHEEFVVYKTLNIFEKEIRRVSRDEVDFEKILTVKLLKKEQIEIEYIEYDSNAKKDTIINLKI